MPQDKQAPLTGRKVITLRERRARNSYLLKPEPSLKRAKKLRSRGPELSGGSADRQRHIDANRKKRQIGETTAARRSGIDGLLRTMSEQRFTLCLKTKAKRKVIYQTHGAAQ
jgi:hypothetical protein